MMTAVPSISSNQEFRTTRSTVPRAWIDSLWISGVDWFLANVPIEPIWLCPLRLRDDDGWPLYPLRPNRTYVNVGFWSTVPVGSTEGETNRRIEREVSELDGHKSLYSDAYYEPDEFDELYGGTTYRAVKRRYDPDARLLDLYAKAVQRR
jgi:FAD/FMN-containing dehydrogenase